MGSAICSLVASLRERGRVVRSPEVQSDFIDMHLHAYLKSSANNMENPAPPVVWRIAHGQYLIGEDRVQLLESHDHHGGFLLVRTLDGAQLPLRDFLHQQAHRAAASGRPLAA